MTETDDRWAALDARIEGFSMRTAYAEETRKGYAKLWRLWTQHCADVGCDPREAPWAAWQDLAKLRRLDGRMYSRTYFLEAVLAAVRWRFEMEGNAAVPAPDNPAHKADWKAVRRNRRLMLLEAEGQGDLDRLVRLPLLREEVVRLLEVPAEAMSFNLPGGTCRDTAATIAEFLVALDTGMAQMPLLRLTMRDFNFASDGSARLGGTVLPCDHRERVRGVTWDCTACAVRRVLDSGRQLDAPFVTIDQRPLSTRFVANARRWPGLVAPPTNRRDGAATLCVRSDLTVREQAGLRRGLVVVSAINPNYAGWLYGRAWIALAWEGGFRMVSDLATLPRQAVSELSDGSGFVVRLGGTKDDVAGRKRVTRVFRFRPGPCAAQALAEYLAVRDAAVGLAPDAPLLIATKGTFFGPAWADGITKPVQAANVAIAKLTAAAGIDSHFTSYSARRGFATQMERDGRDLTTIQRGLRHARPDTTLRYTDRSAQRISGKLADALNKLAVNDHESPGTA